MYLVRTPDIIKPLGKDFVWSVKTTERILYLTFDDGPTPKITERLIGLLEKFNAKATFFCLGQNAEVHPQLMELMKSKGHLAAHHSFDHPDGWKTCTFSYVKNVLKGAAVVGSTLFRPPYGRISFSQASLLKRRFRIVMWDVLTGDFDPEVSAAQCAENALTHAKAGSILVFHDNEKCGDKMLESLEICLQTWSGEGYRFETLENI